MVENPTAISDVIENATTEEEAEPDWPEDVSSTCTEQRILLNKVCCNNKCNIYLLS